MTRRTRATTRAEQQIHEDGTQSENESASAEGREERTADTSSTESGTPTKRKPLGEIVLNVEPATVAPTIDNGDSMFKKPKDTINRSKKSKKNQGKATLKDDSSKSAIKKETNFQLVVEQDKVCHSSSNASARTATIHAKDCDVSFLDDTLESSLPIQAAAVEGQDPSHAQTSTEQSVKPPNIQTSVTESQKESSITKSSVSTDIKSDVGSKIGPCDTTTFTINNEQHDIPKAVQKLESLFNLEERSHDIASSERSVMEVMSRSVIGTAPRETCSDPIEALDELEDAIENAECDFRAQKSKQMQLIVPTGQTGSKKTRTSTSIIKSKVAQDSQNQCQNTMQKAKPVRLVTTDAQRQCTDSTSKSSFTVEKTNSLQGIRNTGKKRIDTASPHPSQHRSGKVTATSTLRQQRGSAHVEPAYVKSQFQRREKVKKQQEEQETKAFKARPIPRSVSGGSVQIRPTAASMARMNSIQNKTSDGSTVKITGKVTDAPSRLSPQSSTLRIERSSATNATTKPRTSGSKIAKSLGSTLVNERSSVAAPNDRLSTTSRPKALSTKCKSILNSTNDANRRQTTSREAFELPEQDRIAKERAELARNARAEAAERNRQQSRLWAAKKAANLRNKQATLKVEG